MLTLRSSRARQASFALAPPPLQMLRPPEFPSLQSGSLAPAPFPQVLTQKGLGGALQRGGTTGGFTPSQGAIVASPCSQQSSRSASLLPSCRAASLGPKQPCGSEPAPPPQDCSCSSGTNPSPERSASIGHH